MNLRAVFVTLLCTALLTCGLHLRQQQRAIVLLQDRLIAARSAAQAGNPGTDGVKKGAPDAKSRRTPSATDRAPSAEKSVSVLSESWQVTPEILQRWLADANDPVVMRRLNLEARNFTMRRYGDLFDQLKLEPQQAVELTMLLADKRQSATDIAVTAYQRGEDLSKDPTRYRELVSAATTAIERQIGALLGEASYTHYRDYDHSVGQIGSLRDVELALRSSPEPLSLEQAERVKTALQDSNSTRITAKMIEEVRDVMSPLQLQTLQDLRAVQQAEEEQRKQQLRAVPTALPIDRKED